MNTRKKAEGKQKVGEESKSWSSLQEGRGAKGWKLGAEPGTTHAACGDCHLWPYVTRSGVYVYKAMSERDSLPPSQ